MAWTITNWSTNPDWADVDILNEFVDAFNERDHATGGAGAVASAVSAGDDVQVRELIHAWQLLVEAAAANFYVSHDSGTPRGAGYWDGEDALIQYSTLEGVFSAAGLTQTDWRRYTVHPDAGGTVAYGDFVDGDIIGPWLFEDIQKALNVMVHTMGYLSVTAVNGDRYDGDAYGTTWAAAKTAAEATWARSGNGARFTAWSRGIKYSPTSIRATLERQSAQVQIPNIWNDVSRDIDWYFRSAASSVTFDAQTDDVIEDKLSLWLTDAPATNSTTIVSSVEFGDATVKPSWCAEPNGGQTGLGYVGYSGSGWAWNLIRWNVTNGFVYQ